MYKNIIHKTLLKKSQKSHLTKNPKSPISQQRPVTFAYHPLPPRAPFLNDGKMKITNANMPLDAKKRTIRTMGSLLFRGYIFRFSIPEGPSPTKDAWWWCWRHWLDFFFSYISMTMMTTTWDYGRETREGVYLENERRAPLSCKCQQPIQQEKWQDTTTISTVF